MMSRNVARCAVGGSATAIGLLIAAPAASQTAPDVAAGQERGVQDIVVTAQRRSENLQKSSLSIQVLASDALRRSAPTQAADLNALVPGIQIASVGSTVQISIRGISDNSSNALGNPSVSFNVDGVYVGRPSSISSNFFDIARIEVLKGPQGTLYGRNASGGAVNLITNAPSLGQSDGYFEIEGGNYALKRVTGAYNAALGDTFAVRAAFQDIDRNGYLSDGSDDQKGAAGRVRALWKPSADVSLLLNLDLAEQHGKGLSTVLRPLVAGQDPWQAINDPASTARIVAGSPTIPTGAPPPNDTFNTRFGLVATGTPRQNNSFVDASAQLDWNLGPATLTVIPAYRHTKEDFATYNGFLYGQRNRADQYSVESRLSHTSASLRWVLGGYYFNEKQDVHATATTNIFIQNIRNNYRPLTKAYAAFGEASYSILPQLRAIAGVRYTREHKTISGATFDDSLARGPAAGTVSELISGNKTFRATTYKAGAEFDLSPRNMLFATVSTGFKSGGFNVVQDTAALPNFYRPEKLTAYVAGIRNRFFDNRLQVNVEGFYYDYRDKQESAIGFTPLNNIAFITSNAGKARIKGGSIDVVARPTRHDTISLFGEYNDNKYLSFRYLAPTAVFNPASSACAQTFGFPLTAIDCSGRPLVKAPKWVGSFGYEHRFDLAGGAELSAAFDGQYSSRQWVGTDYIPGELDDGYVLLNTALTYRSPGRRWTFTAFVKNITDQATYKNGNAEPLQAPLVTATIGSPRTFGGRVRLDF